jgi:hypothetical protein
MQDRMLALAPVVTYDRSQTVRNKTLLPISGEGSCITEGLASHGITRSQSPVVTELTT